MVQTLGNFPSAALLPVGARSHYIASRAHYNVVARRIVAGLSEGERPMVLVTSDPPANPRVLSGALGNIVGARYAVVIIPCGPELTREDVEHSVRRLVKPKGGGKEEPPVSPLFVFDDLDQLSDRQIEDIYKATQRHDPLPPAAVLLASPDFHARLECPALQFLKQRIAAQLRFQEVGDDEAIAVLHDQLLAQRDRRVEARGFRRGILIGSAVGGAAIVASIGFFALHATTERVYEAPAGPGQSQSESEGAPLPLPARGPAPSVVMEQTTPKAETPLALTAASPSLSVPAPAATPPSPEVRTVATAEPPSVPAGPVALPSLSVPALTAAPPSPEARTVAAAEPPPVPGLAGALPSPPVPADTAAPPSRPASAIVMAPSSPSAPSSPPTKVENQLPTSLPAPVDSPASSSLSAAVITALLARGDAFLGTGDITSARLCYERAADAKSGQAALWLGATFDPIVLGRAGVRGVKADPVQALSWYRRARELGVAEAEDRIKALEFRSSGETESRPH